MIKLVLFDIDGTLVRTGGAGMKAFARAFASEFGISSGTESLKFAGRTDVSLVREFFLASGIKPVTENFERFFAAYLFWLKQTICEADGEICPGVSAFMAHLRGLESAPLLGLLTGNIRSGAEIKLARFNLWQEFQVGAFADDHEDRNCIAEIASRRGSEFLNQELRGDEILVIGDTPLDIRCARAIGARVLAVATGGCKRDELVSHAPDWLAQDLTEVCATEICR